MSTSAESISIQENGNTPNQAAESISVPGGGGDSCFSMSQNDRLTRARSMPYTRIQTNQRGIMKRTLYSILGALFLLSLPIGAAEKIQTGDIPEVSTATTLPVLVSAKNEAIIAKSFMDVDPAFVLGSVIDLRTKEVLPFENFLSTNAPTRDVKPEVQYRELVEKQLAISASYLSFVSASLSDKMKAEVSLIKNSVTKAAPRDIKVAEMKAWANGLPPEQRKNYAIIIAYTEYLWTATLFELAERKAEVAGYGANIGGSWHNKKEGLRLERTVVATVAPLVPVITEGEKNPTTNVPFVTSMESELKTWQNPGIGTLNLKATPSSGFAPRGFGPQGSPAGRR